MFQIANPDRQQPHRLERPGLFDVVNTVALLAVAMASLAPFVHIMAVSLSRPSAAAGGFVAFVPVGLTTAAYRVALESAVFLRGMVISVQRTLLGTGLSMSLTILTAYPLSRTAAEFRGRNLFLWLFVMALLFDGGLIPWFLVIRSLGMLDSLWALVVPRSLSLWNVILLMSVFRDVPQEMAESAQLDGASHWRILESIYVPMARSAVAALTLFSAVAHWNEWFDGLILMRSPAGYPLHTVLRAYIVGLTPPARAAQLVLASLPILLLYPFLQRYFVSGLRLGALQG